MEPNDAEKTLLSHASTIHLILQAVAERTFWNADELDLKGLVDADTLAEIITAARSVSEQ